MFTLEDLLRAYDNSLEYVGDILVDTLVELAPLWGGFPIHDGIYTTPYEPIEIPAE